MCLTFLRTQHRVDTVIVDTYSTLNFWYAWAIALLCRAFKKPYITYLHGGDLPARLENSPQMAKAVFGHSFANVAPSGYLKSAFEKKGYPALLIPNFLEIENYPFRLRKQLHPRFLWVRSFQKTYHPEMTIQVFGAIQKTFPEAQLCMVGSDKDGSMEKCRKLAVELNLEQHIIFTGRLSKPEWIALSADYDIFISTTHFDNTPVSVMEAMALGLPVVSTNVGGVPFLLEHSKDGLLSPNGDLPGMIANINRLLSSPDLAERLCQKARQKAETFDWKVVEKQWLDLLNSPA